MDDEDGLAYSLDGLAGLLSGHRALEDTLVRIAEFAVQAIPGADGAGLTLLEGDRPHIVVATAEFVREVDGVQYRLQEGPCVSAVAERQTLTSGNLGREQKWPRFGPRAGRLGVHSALSLPLVVADRVIGALNVYAHGRDTFAANSVRMGELFAPNAAVNVHNAQMLAQAERLIGQLQQALTTRAEIDQAIGILMSRSGGTAAQALTYLRTMSQSRSQKLSQVAHELVEEATQRARARHARSSPGMDARPSA